MGTGGCGSGFIWHLLEDCGLETGGKQEWMRKSGIRKAIAAGTADSFLTPRVIKHLGGFLNNLNEHIDRHKWEVEHIFFAVASFDVQMKEIEFRRNKHHKEFDYETEATRYRQALGKGLIQLVERDHPFSVVRCPRSLEDPRYCYDKLKVVLGSLPYERFYEIHQARILPHKLPKVKYND